MATLTRTILAIFLLLAAAAVPASATKPGKPPTADKKKEEANKKRLEERAKHAKDNKATNEQLGKDIAALMKKYAAEKGFSGSVLVAKDGVVVHKAGYGFADESTKRKNEPTTLFDMGSLGKSFTAAAILKLQEQGKLKLADTLDKFFPGAPKDKAKITLSQLMSHSSGIPAEYAPGAEVDPESRDSVMKYFFALKLTATPGAKFEYSNVNFIIAGAVVEIASKLELAEYLKKNLFDPAGMKDTAACGSASLDRKREAHRYLDGKDCGSMIDGGWSWANKGCGFIVTTAEDMLKWATALEDETVLTEESKAQWYKGLIKTDAPGQTYGLGWFINERESGPYVWHGGVSLGARTIFARFTGDDCMFIFFMNKAVSGSELYQELQPDLEQLLIDSFK